MKQTNKWKKALILLALAVMLAIPANVAARAPVIKTGVFHGQATYRDWPACDPPSLWNLDSCGLVVAQGKITLRVSKRLVGSIPGHRLTTYELTGSTSLVGSIHPGQPQVDECSVLAPNTFTARGTLTAHGDLEPVTGATRFTDATFRGLVGGSFNVTCPDVNHTVEFANGLSNGDNLIYGTINPTVLAKGGILKVGTSGSLGGAGEAGSLTISIPTHH